MVARALLFLPVSLLFLLEIASRVYLEKFPRSFRASNKLPILTFEKLTLSQKNNIHLAQSQFMHAAAHTHTHTYTPAVHARGCPVAPAPHSLPHPCSLPRPSTAVTCQRPVAASSLASTRTCSSLPFPLLYLHRNSESVFLF